MKNRILGMALAAAALGFAAPGAAVPIQRREEPPVPELGWVPRRRRSGKSQSRTPKVRFDGDDAYKRQRRANRLRRKALNK